MSSKSLCIAPGKAKLTPPKLSQSGAISAAFQISKLWNKNRDIRIAFMDGTKTDRNRVKEVVSQNLQPLVNTLNFVWYAPVKGSDIRISFADPSTAWSLMGTDSLKESRYKPTMNLGFRERKGDKNSPLDQRTILHEFGHALGMIHEHQNPKGGITWNKPVVYSDLQKNNGWTKAMVDDNMFAEYGDAEMCKKDSKFCGDLMTNGSTFDPTSVMEYDFPANWTIPPGIVKSNNSKVYSPLDQQWLHQYYGNGTFKGMEYDGEGNTMTGTATTFTMMLIYVIVGVICFILIAYLGFKMVQ